MIFGSNSREATDESANKIKEICMCIKKNHNLDDNWPERKCLGLTQKKDLKKSYNIRQLKKEFYINI